MQYACKLLECLKYAGSYLRTKKVFVVTGMSCHGDKRKRKEQRDIRKNAQMPKIALVVRKRWYYAHKDLFFV